MTSGQKVTLSLLLSILVFSAFTVIAFSGLFNLVEVNFYQPFVEQTKEKKAEEIAAAQKEYFATLMNRFNVFTLNEAVKTYADLRPSDSFAQNREKIRAELFTSTSALTGIRIIDENGQNVYFSTFSADSMPAKNGSLVYKNYQNLDELPYSQISSSDWISQDLSADEKCRILKDGKRGRLIFSFPFFGSDNVFKGTILFYCDAGNLNRFLYNKNLIDVNGFGILVSETEAFGGFVFGLPNYGRTNAENQILKKWKESPDEKFWKIIPDAAGSDFSVAKDDASDGDESVQPFCVFSRKGDRDDFGFIALIFKESEIKLSVYLRILLLAVSFVTFYLVVFLVLSFRHDDIVIIRDRIKKYKNEFLAEYKKLDDFENVEKISDLKSHKKTLENQIKASLGKIGKKHPEEVEELFEKAWNEILLVIGKTSAPLLSENIVVSKNELRTILEDILGSGTLTVKTVPGTQTEAPGIPSPRGLEHPAEQAVAAVSESKLTPPEENAANQHNAERDEVEEIEEAEEAETVEELSAEEAEPVDDAEEVEEAEELSADAEEVSADDVEELDDDLDEVEEIEEAESAEELAEEAEPADDISDDEIEDEIDEAEAAEEAEDVEELSAEEAEIAEELSAEEAESVEDAEEAETVEELSAEEAEPVDDAEEVEEAEELSADAEEVSADDVEELDDDLDEVEEIEEAEEAEIAEEVSAEELAEEAEPADDISDDEIEDEIDEADAAEEAEIAEELSAEEAETVEELSAEEAEPVDDAEEVEEAEELSADSEDVSADDVEELDDDLDEVEEIEEAEEAESAEELTEEAEPADDISDDEIEEDDNLDDYINEAESVEDAESYVPGINKNSLKHDDEIFADDYLLEKIDFGVPEEKSDVDMGEEEPIDFEISEPDFKYIDLDDSLDEEAEFFGEKSSETKTNEQTNLSEREETSPDEGILDVKQEQKDTTDVDNTSAEFVPDEKNTEENKEENDIPELEEVSEIETLETPEETMPFSFTNLAYENCAVKELGSDIPDTIIQNSDGTFSIATSDDFGSDQDIDPDFKKLVDSILH